MDVFEKLGIQPENSGVSAGAKWLITNGDSIKSINPATGKMLATIQSGTQQNYDEVMSIAKAAFLPWREVPAPIRGECIRRIGEELRRYKDALGTLISLETGKIKQEGDGEVQEMIDMADMAVGQSRMLYGKVIQSERSRHRMLEQWHPLGPIGVITAFNFPVAVWAWNAFLAAICGDTIVWKPSPKASLCAIAVQNICNKVMLDCGHEGIFSLFITDKNELAENLVKDERLPLISFTGSTLVGRQVAVQVAQRLGRYLLELSGNNAVIVDESADLEVAIPSIVFGAIGTAGQRCTSTRRVFVHQSQYQRLVDRLIHIYQQLTVGDPLNNHTHMGPLIDPVAVQHFEQAITEIKQSGDGEILYGGEVLNQPGNYVQPTLVKAQPDWPILGRETFAPILYVIPFDTLPQAIAMQNNVRQGLSSALFTENLNHGEYFMSVLGSDCGIANINLGTSGAEIGGAFGGEKDTGGGREAGSDVWQLYMRRQTNTINWSRQTPLAQGIIFHLPDNTGGS